MIDSELEKLPDDIDSLLESERSAPAAPSDARARVHARVLATVAIAPLGAPGEIPVQAPPAPAPMAAAAAGASTKVVVVLLAAGVAVTAAYLVAQNRSREVVEAGPPVQPVAIVQPTEEKPALSDDRPTVVIEEQAPVKVEEPRRSKKPEKDDQLHAERALLETARAAIAQGDAAAAFAALDQHRTKYPAGQLAEEREGMRIVAMVRAGSYDAARSSAADFKRKYPRSLFQQMIDDSLSSIP